MGAARTFAGEGGPFSVDCRHDVMQSIVAQVHLNISPRGSRPDATVDERQISAVSRFPSSEGRGARREVSAARHFGALAASIAAHAVVVGLLVMFASPVARIHREWVLAYLVEMGDGAARGGGARAAAARSAAAAMAATMSSPSRAARRPHRRHDDDAPAELASIAPPRAVASPRPHDAAQDTHPQTRDAASHGDAADGHLSAVSSDSGDGRGGAGSPGVANGGAGAGPDSTSVAHADYARNPPPTYPATARRRAEQGTVTVRVLVAADGSVERAELAESSGFDSLDDAALETVRSRWRFVPARRDGVAVESWVLVPIRFALVEADATH